MDEEPNEHELEERLYAMLHYVDETQANVNTENQKDLAHIVDNAPRSTVRRYWRTSGDQPTPYQKINTPKDSAPVSTIKNSLNITINNTDTQPKEERCETPDKQSVDLSLFQSPPQIVKKTIEIIEHENTSVLLESSDEDEVIEVELPPKPTITIESSDEDEVCIVTKPDTPTKTQDKHIPENNALRSREREVSSSPVPSVVSSVSDEFIRSDCIALNISSRRPDNHSFDFSLHGSDLLGQAPQSKKKKKKKSKESATSTPNSNVSGKPTDTTVETCFATPKSKAKNKKQKTKSYVVSEKSVPSTDVYDSDSNQSVIEATKDQRVYSVTEKSIPSTDVYESDSSQNEIIRTPKPSQNSNDFVVDSSDSSTSLDKAEEEIPKTPTPTDASQIDKTADSVVDLTDSDNYVTLDSTGINENIVMANVTGFQESDNYSNEPVFQNNAPKLGSTKVPQILFENLDFDNLKGKDKVCKRRRYSLTTLRAEMEKFYNESWGGEDFNHREIQKYMSRDKSLWVIDPKDRMPSLSKRKVTCNYCNRVGHRDDTCRMKPPVCYMCGSTGHYEPRCPSKICVNCGSPNHMYSSMCRNCASWARVTCAECGRGGHPASHCPDLWRRYHNTIDNNTPLAENRQIKKNYQMYCSGCTRRGHLVHTCRLSLPFSGLPINSPYVAVYRPIYMPSPVEQPNQNQAFNQKPKFQDATISSATVYRNDRNKRQSKSPTMHENHMNKKKNMTVDITEVGEKPKNNERQRKNSVGKNLGDDSNKVAKEKSTQEPPKTAPAATEKALDFIPISSTNHDKKGQIIQDNEVSDTSDVVTCARIYVTSDIIDRLKTEEGEQWLKDCMQKHKVEVQNTEISSFLSIKGKLADQEAFQAELRDWSKRNSNKDNSKPDSEGADPQASENNALSHNIPKNRNNILRKLSKALDSLKADLGDPKTIYKELNYLQNRHEQLLKNKVISPKQVSNNRDHINEMLKKLNMVLLGQAGLADGSKHLSELYSLHEKLTNFRQKNISPSLRKEIGQHYHSIFSACPREDYGELLQMYYGSKTQKTIAKKHKMKLSPRKRNRAKKKCKSVTPAPCTPGPEIVQVERREENRVENAAPRCDRTPNQFRASEALRKLTFFHRRVMNSRPADSALKKTRTELARKLHSRIASITKNDSMSSKTFKKMKKIRDEAQAFLDNV